MADKMTENELGSDNEVVDDGQHAKLLAAIGSLDGPQKTSLSARRELAPKVSEYNVSATTKKVKLMELLHTAEAKHGEIKKQLSRIQKKRKVLTVPLAKHEQERIHRSIAYETTAEDVSKWDPIVKKHRLAEQLHFPLERADLRMLETTNHFVNKLQPRTPLELEVAKLLKGSKDNEITSNKLLTAAEERALQAMSVDEAKERRAELQKYRVLLSYKQVKAQRQKRIKSRSYRRIARKEKMKKEATRIDGLKVTDPEGYLEEVQQADKLRMEERISLKHRGGSKFSQKQKMYSKYNDTARQAVQDMIQKNKDLTQKRLGNSSSEEDEEDTNNVTISIIPENSLELMSKKNMNPWMSTALVAPQEVLPEPKDIAKPKLAVPKLASSIINKKQLDEKIVTSSSESEMEPDMEDIFSVLDKSKKINSDKHGKKKKSTVKRNKKPKTKKAPKVVLKSSDSSDLSDSEDGEAIEEDLVNRESEEEKQNEGLLDGSLIRRKDLTDFEGKWAEEISSSGISAATKLENNSSKNLKKTNIQVDPKNVMTVESEINHKIDDGAYEDEDKDVTTESAQRMTIAEAFASDDVVEQFQQEKSLAENREKTKDIDLTLPGWGQWGGEGIKPSKRKRRRFLIKAPEAPPRKDQHLHNVIISETKDTSISKHQVNKVPFPFTSTKQFEASIRQPIGKHWNPETAYKRLIKPKVVTRMGAIIEPIDKAETFKKNKRK